MDYVVKLTHQGGQYRVTLPGGLVVEAGLENAEVLRLRFFPQHRILIEEYHGKDSEKRDLPEDQSKSD